MPGAPDITYTSEHDCCSRWWKVTAQSERGKLHMLTRYGVDALKMDRAALARLKRDAPTLGLVVRAA